jgi:hypothetical protein
MEDPDINENKDKKTADEKSALNFKSKQTKVFIYMIIGIWMSMTSITFYYMGNYLISWVGALANTLACGALILAQKKGWLEGRGND